MSWMIALLFAVCVAGLVHTLADALKAGAEAYAGEYSRDTAREFEDLFLFIPPRRIAEAGWAASAIAFLLFFLLALPAGLPIALTLAVITGAVALQLPRWTLKMLRARRLRRFNLQLVDALMRMSNALKAGFSITQAIESVVRDGENPIAQEFMVFLQQTRVGVSFSDALANLDRRVNSDDLTLVILSIEAARKTGGNLTEVFENISHTIRERLRIENRIRTLTAQSRLQGIVVGAMPIVIGTAMFIVDPEMMVPFLRSTVGIGIMAVTAGMVACGGLVIRQIMRIDV